jgi:hypothetical protein
MTVDFGLIFLEAVTLAVIVFGALTFFLLRHWFSPAKEVLPPWLWLRFTILLFGFCLFALVEGILLRPYSFFWVVLVVGITASANVMSARKLLGLQ